LTDSKRNFWEDSFAVLKVVFNSFDKEPITKQANGSSSWENCSEERNVAKLHDIVHLFCGDVGIVVHQFSVEKYLLLNHISLSRVISFLVPFLCPLLLLFVDAMSIATQRFNPFVHSSSALLQNDNDKHHGEHGLIVSLSESDVD